jgi:hypothetical protein
LDCCIHKAAEDMGLGVPSLWPCSFVYYTVPLKRQYSTRTRTVYSLVDMFWQKSFLLALSALITSSAAVTTTGAGQTWTGYTDTLPPDAEQIGTLETSTECAVRASPLRWSVELQKMTPTRHAPLGIESPPVCHRFASLRLGLAVS